MRISSLMISLALVLPYGGRAEEPTAPQSAAATDPPAVEKSPAQLKREAAEAKIRQSGAYGYKPETDKSGAVLYCKRETPIGTHFEQKQCRTFEQLRDEALRGKDFLEQMQRSVPPAKG
jgi:hypothetical protein